MHRTWCTKSYVTKGAQVLSHQDLHTYSTLQYSIYSILHYSTLHYITVKCSTVHYSTIQYITLQYSTYMQRTWKSSVTRGAQVLSNQNVHTYIALNKNTVHYIPIPFSIFSIYLLALKYCLYINRRKKWKITDFCEIFFLEDGHKS